VYGPECEEDYAWRTERNRSPRIVGTLSNNDIAVITGVMRDITWTRPRVIEVVPPGRVDVWTAYRHPRTTPRWLPAWIYTLEKADGYWKIVGSRKGQWRS
jgi:hypothetical protein